ncbi:hypothetical protein D3C81_946130 [compost metagenome]
MKRVRSAEFSQPSFGSESCASGRASRSIWRIHSRRPSGIGAPPGASRSIWPSRRTTGFGRITIIATQAAPKTMAKVTPNSRIVVVGMVVRESSRLGNWGA